LVYPESLNGGPWTRLVDVVKLDVTPEGCECKVIEYPFNFDRYGSRYMADNGNRTELVFFWRCWMNADSKPIQRILLQLFNYTLVGFVTNLVGYCLYITLTYLWGSPKLTITLLYIPLSLFSFFANRQFTFKDHGKITSTFVRFFFSQFCGYFLNLLLLAVFVDWLEFNHKIVQALSIVMVAVFLFITSRKYVFMTSSRP
jgi:putative flippase GtrA